MIPDFEKRNERMEQASLNELAPGFDKEQEWLKLSQKLHPLKRRIPIWSYAAAIVLLLAVGGGLTFFFSGNHDQPLTVKHVLPATSDRVAIDSPHQPVIDEHITATASAPAIQMDKQENRSKNDKERNAVAIKKHKQGHRAYAMVNKYVTKDIICNGTPCPIQICINQTMRCPNIQPATISSCSTLEPDQSGKLSYKTHDKIAKNCSLTINEIEIKSIATGETILLTASSTPSTAQDVFSYLTGQRKGDILAGMFNSDCDHKAQKHNLRLVNSYGNMIIQ